MTATDIDVTHDIAINRAILIVMSYYDKIPLEIYNEIISRLKSLKTNVDQQASASTE